ncbi:hypothetical protein ACFLZ1_01385 [Patescibacteria group bacterium]
MSTQNLEAKNRNCLLEWQQFSRALMTPEEFSRKLDNPEFRHQIAAFGTYSLTYVINSSYESGVILRAVGEKLSDEEPKVNIDLAPDLFRTLYPGEGNGVLGEVELEKALDENRGYANSWIAKELADQQLGSRAFLRIDEIERWKFKLFSRPVEVGQTILDHLSQIPLKSEMATVYNILKATFRTDQAYLNFVNSLQNRRGVQVVLGDQNEFLRFWQTAKHKPIDDYGLRIYSSIPSDLILAIIPLGSYEQSLLGLN